MRPVQLAAAGLLSACASPGMPPGGPVDTEAPQVVRVAPDSGRTGITPRDVVFRFNEVISERPATGASLGALVLISPRDGDPRVDWSRSEIAVRPRRGWRPNTAYTVTLLPGISDLRGNVRNTGVVTIFSTGSTIPPGRITGTLFNWPESRVITRGLVEARPVADTSVVYVTSTDSLGGFTIMNLPAGGYRVRGSADDNNNRVVDLREAWDSAVVQLQDSASLEILAFVHDSLGARLMSIAQRDSVTIDLIFDNPLDRAALPGAADLRVVGPDSVALPITSVQVTPPDTAAARAATDPTPSPAPRQQRQPSRPAPPRSIQVKLGRPLRAGTAYRVHAINVRNLIGVVRSSDQMLRIAVPAAATPNPVIPPSPPAPVRR